MSKVAIKGNASGTGTFTLEAPNSNTDRTLTLPDEAGTVLTSASSISTSQLSGNVGKVLQIVRTVKKNGTAYSLGAESLGELTDLRTSITPTSASSKIIIQVTLGKATSSGNGSSVMIRRNPSTRITDVADQDGNNRGRFQMGIGDYLNNNDWYSSSVCGTFLDEPATTDTIQYGIWVQDEGGTFYLNRNIAYDDGTQTYRTITTSTVFLYEVEMA